MPQLELDRTELEVEELRIQIEDRLTNGAVFEVRPDLAAVVVEPLALYLLDVVGEIPRPELGRLRIVSALRGEQLVHLGLRAQARRVVCALDELPRVLRRPRHPALGRVFGP